MMVQPVRQLLLALGLLVACGKQSKRPDEAGKVGRGVSVADPRRTTAGEVPGCPAPTFLAFLTAFAEDSVLQRRFTRYPLAYATVEDGPTEPITVERQLPRDSIGEPLFLSAAARTREGLTMRIDSTTANRWVVILAKPDTDYQLEFTFERRPGPCWELARYANQSL